MDKYDLQKKITLNLYNEVNGIVRVRVKIPQTKKKIEMNVPATVNKGYKVRAKGMGLSKPNGEKGDFYLVINRVIKPIWKRNKPSDSYHDTVKRELRPYNISLIIGIVLLALIPLVFVLGNDVLSTVLVLFNLVAGLCLITIGSSRPTAKDRCKKCGSSKNREIIESVFLYEENINIKKEVTDTVEHYDRYGVRNYAAGTDKVVRTIYVPGVRKHYKDHIKCQCGNDWWIKTAVDYDRT